MLSGWSEVCSFRPISSNNNPIRPGVGLACASQNQLKETAHVLVWIKAGWSSGGSNDEPRWRKEKGGREIEERKLRWIFLSALLSHLQYAQKPQRWHVVFSCVLLLLMMQTWHDSLLMMYIREKKRMYSQWYRAYVISRQLNRSVCLWAWEKPVSDGWMNLV